MGLLVELGRFGKCWTSPTAAGPKGEEGGPIPPLQRLEKCLRVYTEKVPTIPRFSGPIERKVCMYVNLHGKIYNVHSMMYNT